jgi:hypothetical protein
VYLLREGIFAFFSLIRAYVRVVFRVRACARVRIPRMRDVRVYLLMLVKGVWSEKEAKFAG